MTEQGIYSNERRIEIFMSEWIINMGSLNLALEEKETSLKDIWLDAFLSLAHACYVSCDEILSTYDGNQALQIEGAEIQKISTIVHGIEFEKYAPLRQKKSQSSACGICRTHCPNQRCQNIYSCL